MIVLVTLWFEGGFMFDDTILTFYFLLFDEAFDTLFLALQFTLLHDVTVGFALLFHTVLVNGSKGIGASWRKWTAVVAPLLVIVFTRSNLRLLFTAHEDII